MANVVVMGAQWGDEGKGKIVDWLSERADIVVRFQGGHNAGHTLVIGNQTYKLALLPSGVVRPGKLSVIGIGAAYEDKAGRRAIRAQDLKNLGTLGPKVDRLLVHHNALRRGLGVAEIGKDALMRELTEIAPKVLPYVDNVWALLDT